VRVIAYTRVSTQEQGEAGLGLQAQREHVEAYCKARDWVLLDVVSEVASGATADPEKRPLLDAAITRIEAGEADCLLASKLDRVSRSTVDFCLMIERARAKGWNLSVLDVGVDTTTPQGELIASVLAAMAQFERRRIGERTKQALAVLKANGVQLGRPRIEGPLRDHLVSRIGELRAQGLSLAAVAARLEADGEPTLEGRFRWYPTMVARLAPAS
jgi:DNA invertase Pin-like site-specific DNA recombinase